MSKWREVRFKNAIEFNPRVKLEKNKEYPNIGIADIDENKFHVFENEKLKYIGQSSSKFESGDILFSRITPCLENRKIARVFLDSENKGFGSTEFFIFRGIKDITITSYVGYLAQTDIIVLPAINSMTGASGRQRADRYFIEKLKIKIPDLETQEKIANVLSRYDNLIENNNRRIELLENMAEEIYKEWFVRMRFPGYEEVRFEKGIPEGWEVKKIGDVTNIKYGNNLPTDKLLKNGYEVFGGNGIIGYYKDYMYKVPKILISCRGAASGKIVISNEYSYITNNSLILDSINDRCFEYFKMLFMNQDLSPYVTGSAQPQITITNIKKMKVILPTEKLINKLNNQLVSISSNISLLNKQNENLMKERDMLLPRLMNGSVEVK